jgi:hypothetical protein
MQYPDSAKLHKSDSNYAAPKFPIASHPKLSEKFEAGRRLLSIMERVSSSEIDSYREQFEIYRIIYE